MDEKLKIGDSTVYLQETYGGKVKIRVDTPVRVKQAMKQAQNCRDDFSKRGDFHTSHVVPDALHNVLVQRTGGDTKEIKKILDREYSGLKTTR